MASWGAGTCVFKGGGGRADLLVARWVSMVVVVAFLRLDNVWGDEGLGLGCVDVPFTMCIFV